MRWMRTLLVLVLVAGVACGSGDDDRTAGRASPRADRTSAPDASPDAGDAGKTADPGATPIPRTGGATARPTPTPKPPPPAPAGRANRPRTGSYVYDVSGNNSIGGPIPSGTTESVQVTAEGDVYTLRTASEQPGGPSTTTRLRWSDAGVDLLSMRIDFAGRTHQCTFEPAPRLLRFPLRAETYPPQTGRGQDCEITVAITAVGQEDVQTPSGTWKSWKLESTSNYRFGAELSGRTSGPNWFAPDLGFEVRGERQNSGTFTQQGQPHQYSSTVNTVLRSHP